ncbi:MAG: energy transducer TonB [Gammaproteobacteria bacterium]|nr:energy transducer TonB [Gammaproteobacteria bacterium]
MTAMIAARALPASGRAGSASQGGASGMRVALLLSAALHGALLLVVGGFGMDAPKPLRAAQPVIDVTLLRWPMPTDDARSSEPLATEAAPADIVVDARPSPDTGATSPTPPERVASPPTPPQATEATVQQAVPAPAVFSANIRQMAREAARLGQSLTAPATDSRVRRIDAAAPETVTDAYYLDAWRRKVERIGQINYPQEAREQQLYGTLRLLVSIEPDGALRDVRLLASSGHEVLDEAAMRIVRLAAPFAPFPPAMQELDLLEIDRTWRFQRTRTVRLGEPSR